MASTKARIRAARPEDFAAIGAETFGHDVASYVIEDEKVIGIGGLCYSDPIQAFSLLLPECDKHKRLKVKLFYLIYGLVLDCGKEVYAVASNDYDTAPGLLEHFFFRRIGDHEEGRGLYVWP